MLLFLSELSDEEINVVSDYWQIDDANGDFAYPIGNVSKKHGYTPTRLSNLLSSAPKVGIYELDRCCPSCSNAITFSSRSELKKYINLAPKSLCEECISTILKVCEEEANKKIEALLNDLRDNVDLQEVPYHLKVCLYLLLTKFKEEGAKEYDSKRPVLSGSSWIEDKIYSELCSSLLLINLHEIKTKKLKFYDEFIPRDVDLDLDYLILNGYLSKPKYCESKYKDLFYLKSNSLELFLSQLSNLVYDRKLSIDDIKELKLFISDILVRRLRYIIVSYLERLNIPYDDNKKLNFKIVDMIEKYSLHRCCWLVFKTLKRLEVFLKDKDIPKYKLKHMFLKILNAIEKEKTPKGECDPEIKYESYFEKFICMRLLEKEILNFNYLSLKEIMAVVANKTTG
ncbi:hypothetical protein DN730_17945 [Marinomonas piezotolerans]|uniref:Uncharacterized protein n=1 Tax=Marinomonas piezotolerans TaxID=2213058 RepID=A0A370U4N3_9GAMM|nr:hypothetical protein [Marinomonas piezotolerans]RDL42713.1 hypothetical protein DN730_17945 [Marinomonas piezotolerans]